MPLKCCIHIQNIPGMKEIQELLALPVWQTPSMSDTPNSTDGHAQGRRPAYFKDG